MSSTPDSMQTGDLTERLAALMVMLFGLFGAAFNLWLTTLKFSADRGCEATILSACGKGLKINNIDLEQYFDCGKAFNSTYSEVFGLPVTIYAVAFYILIALIAAGYVARRDLLGRGGRVALFAMAIANVGVSVLMFLIAKFVLATLCMLCLILYVVSFMLLPCAFVIYKRRPHTEVAKGAIVGCLAWVGIGFLLLTAGQSSMYLQTKWQLEPGCPIEDDAAEPPETTLIVGSDTPEVYLDVFVDPTCGHCRDDFPVLRKFVDRATRPVQVRFFHFPRDSNGCGLGRSPRQPTSDATTLRACVAAFAVECIEGMSNGQGLDALGHAFAMQDKVFTRRKFAEVAKKLGVSVDLTEPDNPLYSCLSHEDQAVAARIKEHLVYAYERKIISTPTVFITPVIEGLPRYSLQVRYESGAKYANDPESAFAALDQRVELEYRKALERVAEMDG